MQCIQPTKPMKRRNVLCSSLTCHIDSLMIDCSDSVANALVFLFNYLFIYLLLFIYLSFIHLFIYLFVCLFICYLFIIYLFIFDALELLQSCIT